MIRRSSERIWHSRESGLVVPAGFVADISQSASQSYVQIKMKALALEQLYKDMKVELSRSSDLARLIASAKALSDNWLLGKAKSVTPAQLFLGGQLDRIADA